MARRLGQRDITWLSVLAGLFLLLAVLVLYGAQGYDHPFSNLFLRILGIPGTSLGWGSVALVLLGIPYALLAWLRGPIPAKAVSLLGALVFALGVGGLAGALSETAFAGGGRLAGTLAQMLRDVLGTGMSAVLMGAIAVPGLFLALAPLVIEATKSGAARAASGGAAGDESAPGTLPSVVIPPAAGAGARPGAGGPPPRVAPGRTTPPPVPVKAKPWYPERRVAADGTELPMQLPGADVGPIRYRDDPAPPPKPSPNAIFTAPPAGLKKDKPIAGIRYVDEAPPEPPPKAADLAVPHEDELPEGVRFAPGNLPAPELPAIQEAPIDAVFEPAVDASAAVPMDALPSPATEAPPTLEAAAEVRDTPSAREAPAAEVPAIEPAAPAAPPVPEPLPQAVPASVPSAIPGVRVEIPGPSSKAASALGLDGPALDGAAAAAVSAATGPAPDAAAAPTLHPSAQARRVGHRGAEPGRRPAGEVAEAEAAPHGRHDRLPRGPAGPLLEPAGRGAAAGPRDGAPRARAPPRTEAGAGLARAAASVRPRGARGRRPPCRAR